VNDGKTLKNMTTTNHTKTADEIIAGITASNLTRARLPLLLAFEAIAPDNWKAPIDYTMTVDRVNKLGGLEMIEAAIVFYTGSRPVFSHNLFMATQQEAKVRIQAAGYYAAIGS